MMMGQDLAGITRRTSADVRLTEPSETYVLYQVVSLFLVAVVFSLFRCDVFSLKARIHIVLLLVRMLLVRRTTTRATTLIVASEINCSNTQAIIHTYTRCLG
jgi:hypothetical protein